MARGMEKTLGTETQPQHPSQLKVEEPATSQNWGHPGSLKYSKSGQGQLYSTHDVADFSRLTTLSVSRTFVL